MIARLHLLVFVLALALAACASDDAEDPAWKVVDDEAVVGIDFTSAIGVEDRIWARGDPESVVAFDGERWTRLAPETTAPRWAASPTDLWTIAGTELQRSEDGIDWESVDLGGLTGVDVLGITSVQGSGPDDVWVVATSDGDQAHLFHFDGVDWSEDTAYSLLDRTPTTGCSLAPDDLWLTGYDLDVYRGFLWHWDGVSWTEVEPAAIGDDDSVEVTCGSSDVWIVIDRFLFSESVYRRTGDTWSEIELPGDADVVEHLTVAAAGPASAWVAGTECDAPCDESHAEIWSVESDLATPTLFGDHAEDELAAVWTTASGRTFAFGDGEVLEHVDR